VLHVFLALLAPRLDGVHVRELKDDYAVGRLAAAQAQGLVVASGQILAAVVGDVLLGGLEEVLS